MNNTTFPQNRPYTDLFGLSPASPSIVSPSKKPDCQCQSQPPERPQAFHQVDNQTGQVPSDFTLMWE